MPARACGFKSHLRYQVNDPVTVKITDGYGIPHSSKDKAKKSRGKVRPNKRFEQKKKKLAGAPVSARSQGRVVPVVRGRPSIHRQRSNRPFQCVNQPIQWYTA